MPKDNQDKDTVKKPSAYDKIDGLKDANKGSGGIKDRIKQLGFEQQQEQLAPKPEGKKGPVSPVKNQFLRAKLAQHLVASGRSDGVKGKDDKSLGGKLSSTALGKREQHSATILQGMENATIEYQQSKGQTNLAHPYSAHGPGSDQVGRLLDGHRADEKVTGVKGKTFSGNDQVGTFKGKDFKTVGKAPTNTSGGFSSNFGMLSAVTEGFAQAGMIDQHVSNSNGGSKADQGRVGMTVKGTGEKIGYNLEVPGTVKQTPGMPLAKDEMESRYKSIKRDDDLTHANVVLDPVNDKNGHRMGWTLQTAYAVKVDKPEEVESYSKPSDVSRKSHAFTGKVAFFKKAIEADEKKIEQLEKDFGALANEFKGYEEKVKNLPKRVQGAENKLKSAQNALSKPKSSEPEELEKLAKAVEEAEKALEAAKNELADFTDKRDKLQGEFETKYKKPMEDAKAKLDNDKKGLAAAERSLKNWKLAKKNSGKKDSEDGEGEGGGGGGPKGAGYNPVLGQWTGDRPEKPAEYAEQLKGVDDKGKPLTAHHLYPWNKIVADLNAALKAKDQSGLERIFMFAGVQADANFWKELQKDPPERNYAFSETLNFAVPKICWAPANIMMGPGSRKDDPGEELDAKPSSELGGMTSQSILAELMHKQGGMHKSGLGAMYLRNLRERDGGVAPADKYESKDWGYDGTGKDAKPFLIKEGQKQVGNKMVKEEGRKWTFSPNPNQSENEKNPNLKGNLTNKVPKLAKPPVTPPSTDKKDDKKNAKKK